MNPFDEGRFERLIHAAAGSLDPASLWFIAMSVPERKGNQAFDAVSAARIQDWVRREVGNWPAPIKIGDNLSERLDDKLVFAPQQNGSPEPAHYCALHADGSCLVAVQIGTLRQATEAHGAVWAIGEGSIAWLSVALIRFVAAWAARANVLGRALTDLRLFSSAMPDDQIDLQLWSFAGGTNAPAGDARHMTQPSQLPVDLGTCLSADATLIARSLLLPLLAQFGHHESRHIDAAGAITSDNFVEHAPSISAWAQAIGVAFRRTGPPLAKMASIGAG